MLYFEHYIWIINKCHQDAHYGFVKYFKVDTKVLHINGIWHQLEFNQVLTYVLKPLYWKSLFGCVESSGHPHAKMLQDCFRPGKAMQDASMTNGPNLGPLSTCTEILRDWFDCLCYCHNLSSNDMFSQLFVKLLLQLFLNVGGNLKSDHIHCSVRSHVSSYSFKFSPWVTSALRMDGCINSVDV